MKLDEDNPCPHCGNAETLTDRSEDDFKAIIPHDLQFDFHKQIGDEENLFTTPTAQEKYGIDGNSPDIILPKTSEIPGPLGPPELPGPPKTSETPGPLGPPELPGPPKTSETPGPPGLPEPPEIVTKRVSQDVPLESIMPIIEDVSLDPASLKVYFQLSIEFQVILDKAANYRDGLYRWNVLLPDRLQNYGLTKEIWERISSVGDGDEEIQKHLTSLLKKVFD